ncbi:MAG TPA: c-type cytochrome [Candidatus Acidoferrales bacterium]|jgi:cbb3-type cytochrome c oxidase subunit III|nr:c-type cytochrome [Candidatus Acidoferrales bacterium]
MKSITARTGLLFISTGLVLCVSGCASHPLSAQQVDYPADKVDAHGLFVENCIICHGRNGRTHTFHGWVVGAQNLTDNIWQAETSDAEILHAIKTGPGVMPAFGKKLSGTEIQALAIYVRSFKQTN